MKSLRNISLSKIRSYHLLIYSLVLLPLLSSCKKFIEVGNPKSQLVASAVFKSDETANAAIAGLYSSLSGATTGNFINYQITLYTGLMADELIAPGSTNLEFYQNNLNPSVGGVGKLWEDGYQHIYRCNAILEGLALSSKLTPSLKSQLEGEAKLLRAYGHFYLLNLYGDIPYVTSTDYTLNNQVSRMPVHQVYELIVKDLKDAQSLLADDYISTERTRPNSWVARALLARVYLYQKDYSNAEQLASEVIAHTDTYEMSTDLAKVFLKESKETIWQLKPVVPNYNTIDGNLFILKAAPTNSCLNPELLKAFEANDLRRKDWIDSLVLGVSKWYYPAKYKIKNGSNPTEYLVLLRLAEQYLIRAEARTHQGKLEDAIKDLDVLRQRANLPLIKDTDPSINQAELLAKIEQERRVEFFAEQGHRWLDLKRTGRADAVMSIAKGAFWQNTDVLMPIPKIQMDNDKNMAQNAGYQ